MRNTTSPGALRIYEPNTHRQKRMKRLAKTPTILLQSAYSVQLDIYLSVTGPFINFPSYRHKHIKHLQRTFQIQPTTTDTHTHIHTERESREISVRPRNLYMRATE